MVIIKKKKSKEDLGLFKFEGKKEISFPPAETLPFLSLLFSIYLNRCILIYIKWTVSRNFSNNLCQNKAYLYCLL